MSVPSLTVMDLADLGRNAVAARGTQSPNVAKGDKGAPQVTPAKPSINTASGASRKPFAAMLISQGQEVWDTSRNRDKGAKGQEEDAGSQTPRQNQTAQNNVGAVDEGDKQAPEAKVTAKNDTPLPPDQNTVSQVDGQTVSPIPTPSYDESHIVQQTATAEHSAPSSQDDPSTEGQTGLELQAALSMAALFAASQPTQNSGNATSSSAAGSAFVTAMGGDKTSSLVQTMSYITPALLSPSWGQATAGASAVAGAVASSIAPMLKTLPHQDAAQPVPASAVAQPMRQIAQTDGTAFAQAFGGQSVRLPIMHEGEQTPMAAVSSSQGEVTSLASVSSPEQAAALSHNVSSASVQSAAQGPEASVKMMSFQPALMAAAAPSTVKIAASPAPVAQTADTQMQGGANTLFDLLVKSSAQTGGQSLSSGGEQGGAAHEHASSEHTAQTDLTASLHDDDAGKGGLNVEGGSFLGLVSSRMEGAAGNVQAVSIPHNEPPSQPQHIGGEGKVSALQTGPLTSSSLLAGRSSEGQAGTLTMTVMTSDDAPVHVQLNRSAEGLSSLALQGQDDGTTEALQKTHHILARQLDEAGLHTGMMKIDVLPTEAGQGAHGEQQNMPQQQSQHFGQNQGQNQQGQASFQQAGGFLAGGDGGGQHSQHRTAQQRTAMAQTEQREVVLQEDMLYSPAGAAGGASGGMGQLNISV